MLVHENNKNEKSGEKGQSDIGKRLICIQLLLGDFNTRTE